MLLFCYGTLKQGGRLNKYLTENGAEFKGQAQTGPAFRLYKVNWFPGMVEDPTGLGVNGEVFEIPFTILPLLDKIEAVDTGLFRRQEITLADGRVASTYLFNEDVTGLEEVANGTWPI
jgi:gamma-glutamylcyclotransferase (GGCT)/AIG2-like uncharacterized protein YtfP